MAGWKEYRSKLERLPEWQSPCQMHALYCSYDFHPCPLRRNEAFMLDFWRRALAELGTLTLSTEELAVAMDKEGSRPMGLENLIVRGIQTALAAAGEVAWAEDLQTRLEERGMGWGRWVYRKVRGRPERRSKVFYQCKVLEELCRWTVEWVKDTYKSSVVPESALIQHFQSNGRSERDLKLVLTQLQISNLASLHQIQAGRHVIPAVKFVIWPGAETNVNERDVAFLTAQLALRELGEFVRKVEESREKCHKNVLKLLKMKEKTQALEMLKQEKQLDKSLADLYQKRTKIDSVLLSLVEAEANLSTFSALKAAANGQKWQQVSLEEVESLAEDFEDQRVLASELTAVLAPRDLAEEAELEAELQALEPETGQVQLPEVPSHPVRVERRAQVVVL